MNHKMLRYMLGKMMGVEALLLLFPAFVGLLYKEKEALSFVLVSFVLLLVFLIFGLKKPENTLILKFSKLIIINNNEHLEWFLRIPDDVQHP